MKIIQNVSASLCGLALIVSAGCRTTTTSDAKDVGLSAADPRAESYVVFEDQGSVHYRSCPPGAASLNRFCIGAIEPFNPIKHDAYVDAIYGEITANRKVAQTDPKTQEVQNKITRLKGKLAAGTLTPEATENFKQQVLDLQKQMPLTQQEQAWADEIIGGLVPGKDILYDQGMDSYALASAPFVGTNAISTKNPCINPASKNVDGVCWYRGDQGANCTDTCTKFQKKPGQATIDYAGSKGTFANCQKIGTLFGDTGRGGEYCSAQTGEGCFAYNSQTTYRCSTVVTTFDAKGQWPRYCACE